MFSRISLVGLKNSAAFGYAANVPFFKGRKALSFKPGLNVLFGPNGCGKTTALQMLARTMVATQGGVSVITEASVQDGVDMMRSLGCRRGGKAQMASKVGLDVAHDGQPVVFCDPRASVGLIGGAFDDDFMQAGITEMMGNRRRSHGQAAAARSNVALGVLMGKLQFPKEVVRRVSRERVNNVWCEALDVLEAQMKPSIERGQPSVLLDEPEANFSLVWQARLWELLAQPTIAESFQVIVATHSSFALGITHAHYIDFEQGFRQECESALRRRFSEVQA